MCRPRVEERDVLLVELSTQRPGVRVVAKELAVLTALKLVVERPAHRSHGGEFVWGQPRECFI